MAVPVTPKATLDNSNLTIQKLAEALGVTGQSDADPDIIHEGKAIKLPGDPTKMALTTAIEVLTRKAADEEQDTQVLEWIDVHPMDGAVAFMKAMKRRYGWASPVPVMTFFGPKPPQMRSIKIGPNDEDVIQVPWGRFVLPNVSGHINTGMDWKDDRIMFVINGVVKKKDHEVVKELAALTREILKSESIYKGKAIRLHTDDDGDINDDIDPEFLPVSYINPGELVLNDDELDEINRAIWTPIRHTQKCRDRKIPLKRGALLEGPYGCGKTLTAQATAKIATDHGWTFILLDDVRALSEALQFAKRYQPAVIFAEDAERVAGSRDHAGNDLLNTIDGVVSKNSEIITVLTTNHVEKIERAMLRPGRLDAVVSVRAPDEKSVIKLINIYGRGLIAEGEDLTEVGKALHGNIPATIREVVERSKLGMIARDSESVTAADLLQTATGMKNHLELLNPPPKQEKNAHERLGHAVAEVVRETLGPVSQKDIQSLATNTATVMSIVSNMDNRHYGTHKLVEDIHEKVDSAA